MTKAEYREYIASPHWQQRRKEFLKPYSFCFHCWMPRWLVRIAYDQDLHVHHLSYANLGQEKDCDLTTLCRRCHEVETFGRSDLVAPPSHRCPMCRIPHWNPYSDDCDECFRLKSSGFYVGDELLQAQLSDVDRTLWQDLVVTLCTCVGIDAVVDFMARGEEYFRRDHEWHLKMAAERKAHDA